MALKETLTNEVLKGLFKNNFELANYAIALGEYYIKSGHEVTLDEILDEVKRHPNVNHLEDLKATENLDEDE